MNATEGATRQLGHSLRIPAFRALFASATISTFGAAVSLVSVSWIVYSYTGSAIDITYVGLTGIVPGVVLGLLAGVAADRYNRRSLMVTADLVRMASMGILTAVLFFSGFSLVVILAVMVLVNSFSALFTPASQAVVASLVAMPSLEDANGLLLSSQGVMYSTGAAVGGILVALFGAVWGLGINTLTYALSAVFLIQIATELGNPKRRDPAAPASVRRDFSDGLRWVLARRSIFEATFGYLPVNLLSSFVSPFLVVYAATRFGGNAAIYGYLAAAMAAGAAIGPLVVGRFRTRHVAGILMGSGILVEASAYALVATTGSLGLAILGMAVAGFIIGFANTVYYATIQAVVPGDLLGRVLSIGDFGSFVAIPAGLVAGGLLITAYGIGFTYLFAAIGMALCGLVLLSLRDFRRFGREALPG